MRLRELVLAAKALNMCSLFIGLRSTSDFRLYISHILRRYDEMAGRGLPKMSPIDYLLKHTQIDPRSRVSFPIYATGEGGMSPTETMIIGTVTRLLNPKRIFEIGTFNGSTAATMLLNIPSESVVYSLDLPPDKDGSYLPIDSDRALVSNRQIGRRVYEFGLQSNFKQILCDSMEFVPEPYRNTIELGLIDGAHDYTHVKNDTEKMAEMMAPNGLVFWHDYGGQGRFRDLAIFLEDLGTKIELFRIEGTMLAWTTAEQLRRIRGTSASRP